MGERLKIAQKYIEDNFNINLVLKYCDLSSSTYYDSLKSKDKSDYKPGRKPPGYSVKHDGTIVLDSSIKLLIQDYRKREEFQNAGGVKALHHYLKRDYNLIINHKKIYRICKEAKLLLPKNKKKIKHNKKLSENRKINRPNKLWQFDIKTGYIHGENKYFYLMAIIDVFTREIINYHIGYSCKTKDLLVTFKEAIEKRKPDLKELAIRSDNGPQMTSNMFYNYVEEIGLEHEFIPVKCPNKNAYIESFFSILETQFLQVWYFKSMKEVFEKTVRFIEFYNKERLHGSLNYNSPSEFKTKFNNGYYQSYEVSA